MARIWPLHFWDAPYRPLFLAAAVWALACIAWWPLGVSLGLPEPRFTPVVLWHVHELIFGFFSIAIAGYVLTALPNWAGSPPERGIVLKALALFWAFSRFSMAVADWLPPVVLPIVSSLFFGLLAALILYRTFSVRAYSRALFGGMVLAMGVADAMFMLVARQGDIAGSLGIAQASLIGLALLVAVVGTRLVPALTESWRQHGGSPPGRVRGSDLRVAAISALVLALTATLIGQEGLAHAALVLSAGLLGLVMAGWQSFSTRANPLVAGLHLAFFWLPIGLALKGGLWFLAVSYPLGDAIHALTIGAISGLTMAISGRAACHGSGPQLQASVWLTLAMALIWITTSLRLAVPLAARRETEVETLAAALWCAAWGAFLIGFRTALTGPARRPVLSGKRSDRHARTSQASRPPESRKTT